MKFRTDVTQGGYKILSIHGPDPMGRYAGVIDNGPDYALVVWDSYGEASFDDSHVSEMDLIPEEQPKDDERIKKLEEFQSYASNSLRGIWDSFDKHVAEFERRLGAEQKRINEIHQDCVARINGLRNDYLADQDAVQPARVDALEERLEKLEESLAKVADDVAFDVEFRLKDLEAGRNLPQTPELGQDSITVSKAEWEAFNLIVETFEHYRRRPTPELRTQLDVAINTLRKLREGK
jgi:archaellum component FlaC